MSLLGQIAQGAKTVWNAPDPLQGAIKLAKDYHLPSFGVSDIALGVHDLFPTAHASEGDNNSGTTGQSDPNSGSGGGSSAPATNPINNVKGSSANNSNIQSARDKNIIAGLIGNYNDVPGSISDAGKNIDAFGKNVSSQLGAAAKAYQSSNQNKLDKTNTAIAGNKELIAKNQGTDMRNIAEQVRKTIFNTNLGLGASAGSSASLAAQDAITRDMGKNRAQVLTSRGDQISQQNQDAQKALEYFNQQHDYINQWEDMNKKQLMDEYNTEKATLDKLKNKVPDWKKSDIDSMSTHALDALKSQLNNIDSEARGNRQTLNQLITGMFGQASAVDAANIDITAPAELATPTFDEHLSMPGADQTDPNATSFTNPNITGKKRVGTDILGNPYYIDESGQTVDENGNPITPAVA